MKLMKTERPGWEKDRKILVKAIEAPDPRYGTSPENRSLEQMIKFGIIIIDKQAGPTSHEITAWVKKLLNLDRAGHGGTLDPNVTGVLPICLEDSTKIVQALLLSGKQYITIMRTHKAVKEKTIKDTLTEFEGEIFQRPPVRASVKRRLRKRYIYSINYIEGDGRNWLFKVTSQSGTYIRKLCYDVGEVIGTGAHMQELRRIRSGPFTEDESVTLFDLAEALDERDSNGKIEPLRKMIRPVEHGLKLIPKVWIRDSAVEAICNGAQLAAPGVLKLESGIGHNDMLAIMTQKEELVALMQAVMTDAEALHSDRGVVAKPIRVIMPRGTYPKMW
ncbi:MAG: RNA-guided pseudouridylation complex pseudouridine synthase subunit Cbf5 [Candidatus Thorarchaeota archaeon]|nr:RNA-guided pseudouridylation complex pseudouridine synthase subunit Cbf5 [Candidatus Thorarchaeota archaeon]